MVEDLSNSLTSAFLCTKYFGKFISNKQRCIINISSDLDYAPNQVFIKERRNKFKPVSYSVVKHGIIGLTKYTSTFWNKNNIRCNAVAFGGVYSNHDIKKISNLIPLAEWLKKMNIML